eukprot:14438547-Ditylum_brightwellii.AAC.2
MSSVLTGKKHGMACSVCIKTSYSMCTVYGVSLHFLPTTGASAGAQCFFDYHVSIQCKGNNIGNPEGV